MANDFLKGASSSGPDFIGIGVAKAGTSWLNVRFKAHPQIWVPPKKELHFFSQHKDYARAPELVNDIMERSRYLELVRKRLRGRYRKAFGLIRRGQLQAGYWWIRYLSRRDKTVEWYSTLFPSNFPGVRGEYSTHYAYLLDDGIELMHSQFPEVKLILMLRDPVERVWSMLKFLCKHGFIDDLDDEDQLIEIVNHESVRHQSDYSALIKRWRKYYPKQQLFIGVYDEITTNPEGLLREVLSFLGVDNSSSIIASLGDLSVRVNATSDLPCPTKLRSLFEEQFRGQGKCLQQMIERVEVPWD